MKTSNYRHYEDIQIMDFIKTFKLITDFNNFAYTNKILYYIIKPYNEQIITYYTIDK